jgi:hypothetical protein
MKNYLIIVALFFVSCQKEKISAVDCSQPTAEIEICKKIIIGKWNWSYERYYSRANQAFIIKTPTTEGYSKEIEFKKSGNAYFYKNSFFDVEVNYSVTTLDIVSGSTFDKSITTIIFYDKNSGNRIDFAPIKICSDSLTLNYDFYLDTKGNEKWAKY